MSKDCPKWKQEKRVQQVKAERNISFVEVRKIVANEGQTSGGPRASKSVCESTNTNKTVDKQNRTRIIINLTLLDLAALTTGYIMQDI